MSNLQLDLLYRDKYLTAVNKPHGLLVHRSAIASGASEFALQILRDQLDKYLYPLHRLDRKTGGVLLFAFDEETARRFRELFLNRKIKKKYLAIVRGYTPDIGAVDYPLRNEKGKEQDAYTEFRTLAKAELPVPFGRYSSQRYSLVEVRPETGRMHQIRRHFAHISHPVLGDRPHGCNKQNRLFKERFNMITMMLHARTIAFEHPVTLQSIEITAPLQQEFVRVMRLMGWEGNDDLRPVVVGRREDFTTSKS